MINTRIKNYGIILIGSFLFCAGLNWFIVPLGLYNGGTVGISQIIRTLLDINIGFDIAGILNFMLNIPLLMLAFVHFGRSLFFKTFFSIITQTIIFTYLPIPTQPIIEEYAVSCLMGGILAGAGVGITLRAGGSGGGLDILGLYLTKKSKDFSVGRFALIINAIIYSVCAILFELPVAIYSILYSMVYSMAIDKTHLQNINTSVMIFTKNKIICETILHELNRGVTYWKGVGGYTEVDTYVFYSVLSKYEVRILQENLKIQDPDAFVVVTEQDQVLGNFEIRL
ncbi:YitT family protein [Clostridium paraputrificum]|uniref:YitT family protein n=2 Tax=Clostridium TaxID=1485 RepID=UPI000C0681FA|nr:YitT family protein [Clostridium paraputrificum]MBS5985519.1 YitT family protein [Clostridium sp.]MDB2100254.1 YitT family protein [Clostridium paraputrificum]